MDDLGDTGYEPEVLQPEYLANPKSNHTFVYVCTIQRMQIYLFWKTGDFPDTG